jgi:hypothetical protein
MEKYIQFVNEAKTVAPGSEIKEGDYVIFNQEWQGIQGLKGTIAKIEKVESVKDQRWTGGRKENLLTLKLEKKVKESVNMNRRNAFGFMEGKIVWEETDTLGVLQRNMMGAEIVPNEYIEGVKAGRITKTRMSGLLEGILKMMKFKVTAQYCDATFFDVDKENDGLITYVPMGKMKEVKASEDDFEAYKAKFRQGAKIGRVLKKLNPGLTDPQVESMVGEYKAAWSSKMEHINDRLKVVTGEDIQFWYLAKRYLKGGGSLNSSCMQGAESQGGIAFYANNPQSIALCILLDDNDKLCARALVWRCNNGIIFMDRIYSVRPEHERMLRNFAKENGITCKGGTGVVYGYSGKVKMEVKVKPWSGQWPYLDTFRYDHNKKVMVAG